MSPKKYRKKFVELRTKVSKCSCPELCKKESRSINQSRVINCNRAKINNLKSRSLVFCNNHTLSLTNNKYLIQPFPVTVLKATCIHFETSWPKTQQRAKVAKSRMSYRDKKWLKWQKHTRHPTTQFSCNYHVFEVKTSRPNSGAAGHIITISSVH